MTAGFSLGALITEVAATEGPDATAIAAKVMPQIPDDALHEVYLYVLARYIDATRPRLTQVLARPATASAQPSQKVAAIRAATARSLDIRVKVGDGVTRYLRDCGFAELMAAAEIRFAQAVATQHAGEQYRAAAELVRDHAVATYGDLPLSIILEFEADWARVAA